MSDASFEELQDICRTLLDNADLDIQLDAHTSTITLHFYTNAEIIVSCMDWHYFAVSKSPDDQEGFFVGETTITRSTEPRQIEHLLAISGWSWGKQSLPQELYQVVIHGGIDATILCTRITWQRRQVRDMIAPDTDA